MRAATGKARRATALARWNVSSACGLFPSDPFRRKRHPGHKQRPIPTPALGGIARGIATAALWLALNLTGERQEMAAAVILSTAVCGMHYTGMVATSITVTPGHTVG